jgi:hypothetical protein
LLVIDIRRNKIEDNLKGCNVEEIVLNGDKQIQEDIIKQSLSDKKSDGDVFVLKSKLSILRVSM